MPKIATVCPPTGPNTPRLALADWYTHIPILIKALDRGMPDTILELGSGDCSSTIFHEYASGVAGRHVTSLEHDPQWLASMAWMRNPWHDLVYVPQWNYAAWQGPWGLVMIDQAPEPERIPALEFFASRAEMVVLHDNNYPTRYQHLYPLYKYILHYRTFRLHTSLFSNTLDVTEWFPEAVLGEVG